MITLYVEPYCHTCKRFEPTANRVYATDTPLQTEVTCEHIASCVAMERHIRKEIKKEK